MSYSNIGEERAVSVVHEINEYIAGLKVQNTRAGRTDELHMEEYSGVSKAGVLLILCGVVSIIITLVSFCASGTKKSRSKGK